MSETETLSILDVTIRDGSYAIDYQYLPETVSHVVAALDAAGIDYIEVSHGCGLGARENLGIPAAASDADYVIAARKATKRAKIGVIAGPEPTTRPDDIDQIVDHVDFIRFAANCDAPRSIEPNLVHALKRRPGLEIFLQLMRASRRPKEVLVEAAREAESMGVKTLYLVDTAGYYMPEDVFDVVSAVKDASHIGIGFHGHNNLGMAVANTLAAVWAGAVSVDASLRGMGRAAGNAQLEALVPLLQRSGLAMGIDVDRLLAVGEDVIARLMPPARGLSAIDVLTADANIDLYPLSLYERIAAQAGIPMEVLIRMLGARAQAVEMGPDEVKEVLRELKIDPEEIFSALGLTRR